MDQDRRQHELARRLGELGFALPGTITERTKTCGKPTCRCRDDIDQRHGPYIQWTRTLEGKTVTKLLTAEQADAYRPWFDQARQLRDLLGQLETLSLSIFERTLDSD